MWVLVRVTALAVLAGTGLLLTGHGARLFDGIDRVAGLVGAGPLRPHAELSVAPMAIAAGVGIGVLVAVARPIDRLAGQVVTLLHELGHVVVAAALGARPAGIVLRHDASGHATARWVGRGGPMWRVALAAVAFAGLPAAATVSAAGAHLLLLAGPEAVLWCFAAAGMVVAGLARSLWSLAVAAAFAGLAIVALGDAAAPWASGVVVTVLAATAAKSAADNLRALGRPILAGDDARAVAASVAVPARLVQLGQITAATALSVWTVWLLLSKIAFG